MFRIAYIVFLQLTKAVLPVLSIFSTKIRHFYLERKTAKQLPKGKRAYWIHCASLGEYEMAIPLIDKLLSRCSLDDILITFFSPSGYNQAIKGPFADSMMYLPTDDLLSVKEFYQNYAPQKALLIRYDFWFNFINRGQNVGTEFFLINGRFTADHFIFKWYGTPYLNLIKQFSAIYTSDKSSTDLLIKNKVNTLFTGDTRYDRVKNIAQQANSYPDIVAFIGGRKVLMLGSSWQAEEELAAYLLENKPENLALIIAPHNLKRSDLIAQNLAKYSPKKYTDGNFNERDSVLILNTMGMLSSMYQYADFALIGGGFSGALHNILEPAVWGCHISFGPITNKFPEAKALEDAGFATPITDRDKWVQEINILTKNPPLLNAIKTKAKNYIQVNSGASQRILDRIY